MKPYQPTDSASSFRSAFTLFEILIATALFSIVIGSFITILVTVTRIQVQQASLAEVNQQSQFLLQQVQYYVAHSSLIDMPVDQATTTLRLRMPASSTDPTVITLSGGIVYLQQGSNAIQALSSSHISISGLSFTRRANPPAHDSVDVAFSLAYTTSNIQQMASQMFQTSVARVSAASFDSNLVPSSTNTYSLGGSGAIWTSVNNIVDFSGSSVGINTASPQQALEVNGSVRADGGIQLYTSTGTSTCNSTSRGMLWYVQLAPSANDTLQLCVETSSSAYQWVKLY